MTLALHRSDDVNIFYRHNSAELSAERLMHGARDLPRRLLEPPND
jgi:hypothetical protein